MHRLLRLESGMFYIVDVSDIRKVYALHQAYESSELALQQLEDWYGLDYSNFEIAAGETLAKFGIELKRKRRLYTCKYKYPPSRITFQQKKTWRTMRRRRRNDTGQYIMARQHPIPNGLTMVEWAKKEPKLMTNTFTLDRTPDLIYCMMAEAGELVPDSPIWLTIWALAYNRASKDISIRSVSLFQTDNIQPIPLIDFYNEVEGGYHHSQLKGKDLSKYLKVGFNKPK